MRSDPLTGPLEATATIATPGQLGVRSDRLDDWTNFAGHLLGMQKVDRGARALTFRMDDPMQGLPASDAPGETLAFVGWEVEHRTDLQAHAARLDAAGVPVRQGSRELADRRLVGGPGWFHDLAGNRIEPVHAPMIATDPLVPDPPFDGLRSGPLGMGRAVVHVEDIAPMVPFYRNPRAPAVRAGAPTSTGSWPSPARGMSPAPRPRRCVKATKPNAVPMRGNTSPPPSGAAA